MRVRYYFTSLRATRFLALALPIALAASVATANTAEAFTPGQTVMSADQTHQLGWSTPAVQSRHAEIQNTVQSLGASTVITLKDALAPMRYDFALKLAPGGSSHLAPDGSVIVSDQQGNVIGSFARPWAKDATGKNLATEYVLTGSTMTQIVKTDGAQFPVTADPRYTWGWVTGTIYFNKNETKKFAVGVGVAAFIASFSGPWAPLMRGYAAYIGAVAGWAVADGKCVAFKSTLVAYEYGGSQGGGYCR
jgi:hypothetical protein